MRAWIRPSELVLLLPSVWMVLAWLLPGGRHNRHLPALAAFMVRLLIPTAGRLRGGERWTAIAVVALVMLASFVVGTRHPRLLTCDDFSVSGNFAPPGCSPGTGTTER